MVDDCARRSDCQMFLGVDLCRLHDRSMLHLFGHDWSVGDARCSSNGMRVVEAEQKEESQARK